jgi:hypothetical protein
MAEWKDVLIAAMPVLQVVIGLAQRRETSKVKKQVRETAEQVQQTKGNTEAIHSLVNGQSTNQLEKSARFARRIADLTKDPNDVRAAELEEQMYLEKRAAQQRSEG